MICRRASLNTQLVKPLSGQATAAEDLISLKNKSNKWLTKHISCSSPGPLSYTANSICKNMQCRYTCIKIYIPPHLDITFSYIPETNHGKSEKVRLLWRHGSQIPQISHCPTGSSTHRQQLLFPHRMTSRPAQHTVQYDWYPSSS